MQRSKKDEEIYQREKKLFIERMLIDLRRKKKIPKCSTYHELKTAKKHFNDLWIGLKTFEVRLDDRKYKKGDVINLRERCYSKYTDREIFGIITHVLKSFKGLQKGYVVFSFDKFYTHELLPISKKMKRRKTPAIRAVSKGKKKRKR